jgi:hypothetical protein
VLSVALGFVTQAGRTICHLGGEEHEDVTHRGESDQSELDEMRAEEVFLKSSRVD